MPRFFYILFIALIFTSCSRSKSNILPREKMEKVLWDVGQSSEFLSGYIYYKHPEQNRAALHNEMLERVFKIHKITKEQFFNTLDYYKQHPDGLKTVLDSLVAKEKRKQEKEAAATPSAPAATPADSLAKAATP